MRRDTFVRPCDRAPMSLKLKIENRRAELPHASSVHTMRTLRRGYGWRSAHSMAHGNARLCHFDAFGPTLSEQHRVIVSSASTGVWKAVLADELDSHAAR